MDSDHPLCLRMHYQAVFSPVLTYLYSALHRKLKKCILNQVPQSLWHRPKSPKLLCSRPKHSEAYLTTRKLLFSKWITVRLWVVFIPASKQSTDMGASEIFPSVSSRGLATRSTHSTLFTSHGRLCLLCLLVRLTLERGSLGI